MTPTLDAAASSRWLRLRSAQPGWLYQEVGRRMAERLQWLRAAPERWVHWMPDDVHSDAQHAIEQRYPKAVCHLVAPPAQRGRAAGAWRRWLGLAPRRVWAAPPDQSVGMVWSNMCAHALVEPAAVLAQWQRWLQPGGFLMFSCLGPDTLAELRAVYSQIGWPPCAQPFTDMHDWGDALVHAGFAEPVMDMERFTLTWPDAAALLAELRTLGRNLHPERFAGLRTRRWRQELGHALNQTLAAGREDGRLGLSFEIIYGHAFKPAAAPASAAQAVISLAQLRRPRPPRTPG